MAKYLIGFGPFSSFLERLLRNLAQAILQHKNVSLSLFLPVIVVSAFRFACGVFNGLIVRFAMYRDLIQTQASGLPSGSFSSWPALAFVNSVFPLSEGLTLTFALLGLWVAVLGVKFVMWVYNKIPLKAS